MKLTLTSDCPTASLQIPYTLTLAGLLWSYMSAFPFSSAIFPIFAKFDRAFVSLLQIPPEHTTTPGVRQPTKTERVRIKSIVEGTRVAAVNSATESGLSASILEQVSDDEDDQTETEGESASTVEGHSRDDSTVGADLGRIYRSTLEILGDNLT